MSSARYFCVRCSLLLRTSQPILCQMMQSSFQALHVSWSSFLRTTGVMKYCSIIYIGKCSICEWRVVAFNDVFQTFAHKISLSACAQNASWVYSAFLNDIDLLSSNWWDAWSVVLYHQTTKWFQNNSKFQKCIFSTLGQQYWE